MSVTAAMSTRMTKTTDVEARPHLAFNKPYMQILAETANASYIQQTQKKRAPQIGVNQTPLHNLFTSMLQQARVETSRFSSDSGSLYGLEAIT